MKEIELTQGKIALIDDEDFERVSKYKWYADKIKDNWYAATTLSKGVSGKKKNVRLHKFILNYYGSLPVDHKNHNTLDNRKENLRIGSRNQNNMNRMVVRGESKFKGVSWSKSHNKWRAYINLDSKQRFLGRFVSEADAARAYDRAAVEWFGEFACTNQMLGLLD